MFSTGKPFNDTQCKLFFKLMANWPHLSCNSFYMEITAFLKNVEWFCMKDLTNFIIAISVLCILFSVSEWLLYRLTDLTYVVYSTAAVWKEYKKLLDWLLSEYCNVLYSGKFFWKLISSSNVGKINTYIQPLDYSAYAFMNKLKVSRYLNNFLEYTGEILF